MKTTKIIWMMVIASGIFTACQSNNKTADQRSDTSASAANNSNGADHLQNNATPIAPSPAPMATTSVSPTAPTATLTPSGAPLMDTTGMVCVPRKVKHQKMAYSHRTKPTYYAHKHYRSAKKVNKETETTVSTTEPTPPPTVAQNAEVTPPATSPTPTASVTYEKRSEFTGNVPAAPPKRPMVHLGFEAGGNLNNLYMRSEDFQGSNELKVGFHGGINLYVEMGRRWGFEPGLRYIMKGGQITSTSTDGVFTTDHKEKLTLHYLEMPLNFVYNTGDWGTNHFMIGFGPYASLLLNAQDKVKDKVTGPDGTVINTGQNSLTVGDPSTPGHVASYDLGAGAFVGYQMKNGVYVKGGAEMGFIDLAKDPNNLGGFNNRNYNFLLSIGYLCGYNKK